MSESKSAKVKVASLENLDDIQKRRLRSLRRAYRADSVSIKDNGWSIEVKYMDGSSVIVDAKMLKLKSEDLKKDNLQ